jgi:hypothetical protein
VRTHPLPGGIVARVARYGLQPVSIPVGRQIGPTATNIIDLYGRQECPRTGTRSMTL